MISDARRPPSVNPTSTSLASGDVVEERIETNRSHPIDRVNSVGVTPRRKAAKSRRRHGRPH